MQVIPWSAMKNPIQKAVNGARGTIKIKISGVYLRLHAQYQFVWAWTFNKYFSLWSWCLYSLTQGQWAHIRYLLCASNDSVSERVTHTPSLMNIMQKIPQCEAMSCVFPAWHPAKNCWRASAVLWWKHLNGNRSRCLSKTKHIFC